MVCALTRTSPSPAFGVGTSSYWSTSGPPVFRIITPCMTNHLRFLLDAALPRKASLDVMNITLPRSWALFFLIPDNSFCSARPWGAYGECVSQRSDLSRRLRGSLLLGSRSARKRDPTRGFATHPELGKISRGEVVPPQTLRD